MSVTTAPAKHTAPGQYLGFALQPVRLCHYLLTCKDGAYVSMEHTDDVAIHTSAGAVIREQMKSALSQNPLSDFAVDLWKTINIWLESVASGESDIETTWFRYYVTPTKSGGIAEALSKASTPEEAAAVTAAIRKVLGKKKPACLPYLQPFLDMDAEERAKLISRITIISVHDDPVEPLRERVGLFMRPELIDDTCAALIGMAKEEADSFIRRKEPAVLSSEAFKTKAGAWIRRVNWPMTLTSMVPVPTTEQVQDMFSVRPTFIRQLEFIDATDEERLRAVSDFLRSSADKSYWAEKGTIYEDSLNELDSNLIMRQGAIAGMVGDLNEDKPAKTRGRLVYRQCIQLTLPLEGQAVPGHFLHGCLNDLADKIRLGWHPDYTSLLGQDD